MTQKRFLAGAGVLAVAAVTLALALRFGLGARWYSFYGPGTVALATLPFAASLLWKRLPAAGLSRWWTLAYAAPVLLIAGVQVGYWSAFFAQGPANPTLGIVREMVRPALDRALPWGAALLLIAWTYLMWRAARPARR